MRTIRVAALALAAALGCGGRSASHRDEGGARTAGGAGGDGVTNASSGGSGEGGASGGNRGGGGTPGNVDAGGTSSVPPPPICATAQVSGQRRLEGFVFTVDRAAGIAGAWDVVEKALLDLFSSPASAEMSIGLRFFPDDRPVSGCNVTQCSRDACSALLVPVAPLSDEPAPADQQQEELEVAVSENLVTKEGPVPGVALAGALAAAADATTKVQETSVVLVTAGEVDACGVELAEMAADAYDAMGTRTFVVAPTSVNDFSGLDAIAAAGGTVQAIRIGPPDGESLSDVLVPIRSGTYACSISVPDLPEDVRLKFDAALMQVTLDGDAPMFVPQVAGLADCTGDFGWFYDDPDAPASVVFCPSLCAAVAGNRDSELVVSFPCQPPPL